MMQTRKNYPKPEAILKSSVIGHVGRAKFIFLVQPSPFSCMSLCLSLLDKHRILLNFFIITQSSLSFSLIIALCCRDFSGV